MDRCEACPRKHSFVPSDGPEDAEIVFVGEAPGFDEDRKKVPFIGKAGAEVNAHYLPLAGLKRPSVRIANAIHCLPDRDKGKLDSGNKQDLELLDSCASAFLYNELDRIKPKMIVPMGAFACLALDPTIDLELHHGIPRQSAWGTLFPMYHPAGGIHEPKKMLQIRTDWYRLGRFLKGKLTIPVDQYPEPDYAEATLSDLELDSKKCNDYIPMGQDTETKRGGDPFCLTYSVEPGRARLIRADNSPMLRAFQEMIDQWKGPILYHNWATFDYNPVAKMGLRLPIHRIIDTMVLVYHLGNLPQGLKALAYRELGMTMQDFDDLVTPYSKPIVLDYLGRAYHQEWPKPEPELVRGDDSKWKVYKAQGMKTKLKRFFTDWEKNPNLNVFERWDNWGKSHAQIEAVMGPWPGKCITHVPLEKVIFYACRDADTLVRLYPLVKAMRQVVRKKPQEQWREEAGLRLARAS